MLFYVLVEYTTLVKEMLLMISGDIEPNPGPGEYLGFTVSPKHSPSISSCVTVREHTKFRYLYYRYG